MSRLLLFFSLFVFATLSAEEEIVVQLKRSGNLRPLYLDALSATNAAFDQNYLNNLEKVLRFDLSHNGKTMVVERRHEWIKLCKEENNIRTFLAEKWEEAKIHAVVKGEIAEKNLSVFLFEVKGRKIKGIEGIALTGDIALDRRKIHEIADLLLEALFGEKGIASTHILYTVRTKGGEDANAWKTEIWEADYDGASPRKVISDGKLCVTPTYVPRGNLRPKDFLYVSYKTGQPKIYVSSLNEGESKRITFLRGNQLMPTLSPKRDLIAFISDILGNPELFVQNFEPGKGVVGKPWQLTSLPSGAQGSPTFSPDGSKIAFVSNKDGATRIYVTDVAPPGTSAKDLKLKLITKKNRENTCPVWSPDGKMLAYSGKVGGTRQIWVYDFERAIERQITEGSGDKENPSWAPNSKHLVYHCTNTNSSELYMVHVEQKNPVQITKGCGEKRFPSWEPFSS